MKNRTYHPRGELVDGFRCQAHPLYHVWSSMLSRCYNPSSSSYGDYGARGIKVDLRWHHFKIFAHDMGIRPGDQWTIERKDNGRGYEKSNCVWATRSDQCVNRRLFKNNASGRTGILKVKDDQWRARFDYLGVTYTIGVFTTREQASLARDQFVNTFHIDREKALSLLVPKDEVVWNNAKTGVRGVTPHKDGGYTVRCTIDGVRHYVGYFKTIEEGEHARHTFVESKTC